MRRLYIALGASLVAAMILTAVVLFTQPKAHAQAHNAYWPYSVETVIRDK